MAAVAERGGREAAIGPEWSRETLLLRGRSTSKLTEPDLRSRGISTYGRIGPLLRDWRTALTASSFAVRILKLDLLCGQQELRRDTHLYRPSRRSPNGAVQETSPIDGHHQSMGIHLWA